MFMYLLYIYKKHITLSLFKIATLNFTMYILVNLTCPLKHVSAIFHYFYKTNMFLRQFERTTLKRNLTYSGISSHCFTNIYSLLGYHALPASFKTSCLEKITVFVIETMLVTLPFVQMNKARREVNRINQVQTKINIVKGLQTSVIHLSLGAHAIEYQIELDIF